MRISVSFIVNIRYFGLCYCLHAYEEKVNFTHKGMFSPEMCIKMRAHQEICLAPGCIHPESICR
jgi:hypothetical protein